MYRTGRAEIVLIVDDVPAAARFYCDGIGLTPQTAADATWAWFWAGPPGHQQRVALRNGGSFVDEFLQLAIAEARATQAEGGYPFGAVPGARWDHHRRGTQSHAAAP